MRKITVVNNVTLDGVIQFPTKNDEDTAPFTLIHKKDTLYSINGIFRE